MSCVVKPAMIAFMTGGIVVVLMCCGLAVGVPVYICCRACAGAKCCAENQREVTVATAPDVPVPGVVGVAIEMTTYTQSQDSPPPSYNPMWLSS